MIRTEVEETLLPILVKVEEKVEEMSATRYSFAQLIVEIRDLLDEESLTEDLRTCWKGIFTLSEADKLTLYDFISNNLHIEKGETYQNLMGGIFACLSGWEKLSSYMAKVAATITYDVNDGVAIEPTSTYVGLTASPVPSTTRDGYDFDGLYEDDETFATEWTDESEIEEDITVYVKWIAHVLEGLVGVSGTAQVGEELTAELTEDNNTGTLAYQWQSSADGSTEWTDIDSETSSTYTVLIGDLAAYLRCEVSSDEQTGELYSDPTEAVIAAA